MIRVDASKTLSDHINEFLTDNGQVQIAAIDLNNDGVFGLAVFALGSMWCGAQGCPFELYENGGLLTNVMDFGMVPNPGTH